MEKRKTEESFIEMMGQKFIVNRRRRRRRRPPPPLLAAKWYRDPSHRRHSPAGVFRRL